MKQPNKVKNGVKSLIKDACSRLRMQPQTFMQMVDWAQGHGQPKALFASTCCYIEEDENRSWINDSRYALPYTIKEPPDSRYGLLFDLILTFLINDASQFWHREFVLEGEDAPAPDDLAALFGSEGVTREIKHFDRPNIPWNDEQSAAFKAVFKWFNTKGTGRNPVFRLFGFAGTGKTQMIKEIAWRIQNGEGVPRGQVMFASYTGKAAAVMRDKGCEGACTLHSLIYRPKVDAITGKIKGVTVNRESPLKHAAVLVVDEVSMVNYDMAMDILSFGVPVIVVGDPFQLKPIEGTGYFIQAKPDVMLTKVERQAEEDPLIWLSMRLRNKQKLKPGRYGDTNIYALDTRIEDEHIITADQMLMGTHRTRNAMNKRYRMLKGYFDVDSEFPTKGERLLCKKNNAERGLLNGTQWHCSAPKIKPVKKFKDPKKPALGYEVTKLQALYFKARSMDLFNSEGKPLIVDTSCSTHHFDVNLPEPPWQDIAATDTWTFAYGMTTHSAQGSQWDTTLIIDESDIFADQKWEHFYTNLTRTAKSAEVYLA